MSDDLLHRDDLPFEVAEEAVRMLKELHPGHTVHFAGDVANDPKCAEITNQLNERFHASITNGTCFDCGAKIPGDWPPEDGKLPEGWSLWGSVKDGDESKEDEQEHILCPACGEDGQEQQ